MPVLPRTTGYYSIRGKIHANRPISSTTDTTRTKKSIVKIYYNSGSPKLATNSNYRILDYPNMAQKKRPTISTSTSREGLITTDGESWQQLQIEDAIHQIETESRLENAVGFQMVLDAFQTMNKHVALAKDQADWLLQNSPYPGVLGKFDDAGILNDTAFHLHWQAARTIIQLYDQMAEYYNLEKPES